MNTFTERVIGIPNLIYDKSKNNSVYHIYDKPIIVQNDKNIYRTQIENPVLSDYIVYDDIPIRFDILPEKCSNLIKVKINFDSSQLYSLNKTDYQAIGHIIHGKIIGVRPRNIHNKIEKESLKNNFEDLSIEDLDEM